MNNENQGQNRGKMSSYKELMNNLPGVVSVNNCPEKGSGGSKKRDFELHELQAKSGNMDDFNSQDSDDDIFEPRVNREQDVIFKRSNAYAKSSVEKNDMTTKEEGSPIVFLGKTK